MSYIPKKSKNVFHRFIMMTLDKNTDDKKLPEIISCSISYINIYWTIVNKSETVF